MLLLRIMEVMMEGEYFQLGLCMQHLLILPLPYMATAVATYIHSYVEFLFSYLRTPVFHITVTVVS